MVARRYSGSGRQADKRLQPAGRRLLQLSVELLGGRELWPILQHQLGDPEPRAALERRIVVPGHYSQPGSRRQRQAEPADRYPVYVDDQLLGGWRLREGLSVDPAQQRSAALGRQEMGPRRGA